MKTSVENEGMEGMLAASLVVVGLSDDELITLGTVAALNMDPRVTRCWPAAEPLFTIYKDDGVPTMHEIGKAAVALALQQRGLLP